jgi:hypothetical protein
MSLWTIKTEFCNKVYTKKNFDIFFEEYIYKIINILLLRDDEYFKNQLKDNEYDEFIKKINLYKNIHGKNNEDISLYFTIYNFSENLQNKLLEIRNIMGIHLLYLYNMPVEIFKDNLHVISKNLKKTDINCFSQIIQEIAFDLGCSSYAIGKIYDYFSKVSNNKNILDYKYFMAICDDINSIIFKNMNIFFQISEYSENEKEEIKHVLDKQKHYYPINYKLTNRMMYYFIKQAFN